MGKYRDREPVRDMIRSGLTNEEIMQRQDVFSRAEVNDIRYKFNRRMKVGSTFVEEQRKRLKEKNEPEDAHNQETVNCYNIKINRSCVYSGSGDCCEYMIRTGRRRGCDPHNCDRYKKRKRNRRDNSNDTGMD